MQTVQYLECSTCAIFLSSSAAQRTMKVQPAIGVDVTEGDGVGIDADTAHGGYILHKERPTGERLTESEVVKVANRVTDYYPASCQTFTVLYVGLVTCRRILHLENLKKGGTIYK